MKNCTVLVWRTSQKWDLCMFDEHWFLFWCSWARWRVSELRATVGFQKLELSVCLSTAPWPRFFGEGDLNRHYFGRKWRWVVNITFRLFHPRVRTRFVCCQRLTTVRFEFVVEEQDDDRGWLYSGYQMDCFQFKYIATFRNKYESF